MSAGVALATALAIFGVSKESEEGSYDALVEAALAARSAGDLEKSLGLLERAFLIDPSPGLRNNIGRLQEELGNYRLAADSYRAAASDPAADAALKKRDEERLKVLAPKLESGWLRLALTPQGALVLVDGSPLERARDEFQDSALAPGDHFLEVRIPNEPLITLFSVSVERGVRTVFDRDVRTLGPRQGEIEIDGGGRVIAAVTIDAHLIALSLYGVSRIRTESGAHRMTVALEGGSTYEAAIDLWPGRVERLAGPALLAQKDIEHGPRVAPWIVAGGGAGLLIAAVILEAIANGHRDTIRNAERNANGDIIGLSFAQADALESKASTQAGVGRVLLGAGAVAIAAGTIWGIAF